MDTYQQAIATRPPIGAGDGQIKKEYCRVCDREIKEEKDRDHYEAWCVG